jgi:hypothetical protein
MTQNPQTSSSNPSSDAESFHSTLTISPESKNGRREDLSEGKQEIYVERSLTQPTLDDEEEQNTSSGFAAPNRVNKADNILREKLRAQVASSESPRKRRRYKAAVGPKAPIPQRRSSVPIRRKGQDLISFHRQSCRLFQSLEGTLARSQQWTDEWNRPHSRSGSVSDNYPSSQCIVKTENGFAYLTSTPSSPRYGTPRNSRRNSSIVTPPLQSRYCDVSSAPATTSSSLSSLATKSTCVLEEKNWTTSDLPPRRPHPVSVLSWTSAESRRLEYEKIDRSYSGVRGFWKRVMPRWCHGRHARRAFFDGKSSDVGSVRRYRLALDDDETEDEDQVTPAVDEEPESRRTIKKNGRLWKCLTLMR